MILTTWLIGSFLAMAFATPCQRPMNHEQYTTQNVVCNDAAKRLHISQSIDEARQLAQVALGYIDQAGVNSALYTAYWPAGQQSLNFVRDAFTFISNAQEGDRSFECADELGICDGLTPAYFAANNVYYCEHSNFYTQVANCALCGANRVPVNARRIRGGSTLHELAHAFNPNLVTDQIYGCPESQHLPNDLKTRNADNYHCFALAVFAIDGCHLC